MPPKAKGTGSGDFLALPDDFLPPQPPPPRLDDPELPPPPPDFVPPPAAVVKRPPMPIEHGKEGPGGRDEGEAGGWRTGGFSGAQGTAGVAAAPLGASGDMGCSQRALLLPGRKVYRAALQARAQCPVLGRDGAQGSSTRRLRAGALGCFLADHQPGETEKGSTQICFSPGA